jgi:hypothetical protein
MSVFRLQERIPGPPSKEVRGHSESFVSPPGKGAVTKRYTPRSFVSVPACCLVAWISGSADQRWMVLPRRSRGQTQATRGVNDRPQGQLACLVLLPVWAFVLNTRGCPPQVFYTAPVIHPVRGCINSPGKQVNACGVLPGVDARCCPTACAIYVKKLGVYWGLVDKISPAFELRNSGAPAVVLRSFQLRAIERGHSRDAGIGRRRCLCRGTAGPLPPPAPRPCP